MPRKMSPHFLLETSSLDLVAPAHTPWPKPFQVLMVHPGGILFIALVEDEIIAIIFIHLKCGRFATPSFAIDHHMARAVGHNICDMDLLISGRVLHTFLPA